MDRPLTIAFHNMHRSESLEAEIRRLVGRLETRFGALIGCRVSVEALHQQHRTGNLHEVHITMAVPGKELVVSHAPHHAREKHVNPDAYACVHDAFKAAERQLDAHYAANHNRPRPGETKLGERLASTENELAATGRL